MVLKDTRVHLVEADETGGPGAASAPAGEVERCWPKATPTFRHSKGKGSARSERSSGTRVRCAPPRSPAFVTRPRTSTLDPELEAGSAPAAVVRPVVVTEAVEPLVVARATLTRRHLAGEVSAERAGVRVVAPDEDSEPTALSGPPDELARSRLEDPRNADAASGRRRRPLPPAPTFIDPRGRPAYAIGDIHGDLDQLLAILRSLSFVDRRLEWIGGDALVVQLGDLLDRSRSGDERILLDLTERWERQADAAGGAFIPLNGNHEFNNLAGNFSATTRAGFRAFAGIPPPTTPRRRAGALEPPMFPLGVDASACAGRCNAFLGRYGDILARRNVFVVIGKTVFVHASLRAEHLARGLARINDEFRRWASGCSVPEEQLLEFFRSPTSPIWDRAFGRSGPGPELSDELVEALVALGAERVVKGHDAQSGIASVCDGKIWRVDVGLSRRTDWQILKLPANAPPEVIASTAFADRKKAEQAA